MSDRRTLAIFGVLFALGFPALPISSWCDEFADVAHLVGYEALWWTAVGLLLLYVRFAERLSLGSIGVHRPSLRDVLLGVATGVAILAGLVALYTQILPALHVAEAEPIAQLMATPVWWRIMSVVRAAVAEEVLFRGYALERLETLTRSARLAGFVSWALFTIEHVGVWGWGHILVAGFAGALLTLLYLWRRNLWVNILAHLVVDATAVLAG